MYMTTLSYRYQPCLDHLQWMGQYKKQPAFQLSDLAQEFVLSDIKLFYIFKKGI